MLLKFRTTAFFKKPCNCALICLTRSVSICFKILPYAKKVVNLLTREINLKKMTPAEIGHAFSELQILCLRNGIFCQAFL